MTRALLASVVSKVLDESTGAHYYFNALTGETSWSKPALFGAEVNDVNMPKRLERAQKTAVAYMDGPGPPRTLALHQQPTFGWLHLPPMAVAWDTAVSRCTL